MSPAASEPDSFADRLCVALATLFGVGHTPKIPGTVASLLTLPPAYFLAPHFWMYVTVMLLVTALSIPICGRAAKVLGQADPSQIVLDEVAGMFISCVPLIIVKSPPIWLALATFALFRLFDIWKPGYVGKAEQLHGGLGIVLDDVIAGVLSAAVLLLIAVP